MKTLKTLLIAMAILASFSIYAQVAVNTDGSNADPSAMLDVKSTTKGLLPPRMTESQRDGISSPAKGLTIYNTDKDCLEFFNGSNWINLCEVAPNISLISGGACSGEPEFFSFNGLNYRPIESGGKCWLDRNLGATQVATTSDDANSYGYLYQWGRAADGHQLRTSGTTTTLSNSDTPGHGDFITLNSTPFDWRNPQNDNLWQGVSGINNPCPSGYRLPTEAEWEAERQSWGSNNAAGAFASPLKLPVAGNRYSSIGSLGNVGSNGNYWSSTVSSTDSRYLYFHSGYAGIDSFYRATGCSVRCLKD